MTDLIEPSVDQHGNASGVARQHEGGKLTARERIELLLDQGSFKDIGAAIDSAMPAGAESVVAGRGCVNGRTVFVYAQDMTFRGGAMSQAHARKIAMLQDAALRAGTPLIGLFDSLGVEIEDGIGALAALSDIFQRCGAASGVNPQISLIMGPCVGGNVFVPPLSDFVFMVRDTGALFATGPEVVRALANESLSAEDLGGALVHSVTSGLADGVYDNDVEALLQLRRFIDFLPSSNAAELPEWPSFDDPERIEMSLDTLVPEDPTRSYDVKELIVKTVDEGDFFEIQEAHAQNIVIGFGRIAGRPIGLIANQPLVLGGVLDTSACSKAARFVRFCDCFNIPLVTFVDVPGFLPGIAQEHGGLAKAGAKLLFSYAQATVPKITITLRKGFGAAFAIMGSKHLRGDRAYAWPSAQIALMGVQGAVAILHPGESEDREMIAERARDYEACVLSPIVAAACGLIDEIILPSETRPRIARALAALRSKHVDNPVRKHDNIPL